ncbi:MAG: hypothetical protein LBG87_01275 [Spirochaetaceae bacterium]|nr:hypothetical protein [Spirochaetaceae bacterium]
MTAQEAAEWGKTLDFPTVWAALTKMGERVDKMAEKVDQTTEIVADLSKSTTENINALSIKIDRTTETVNKLAEKVDRVTGNVGGLNHSMGDLIETLFTPRLGEKFDAYHTISNGHFIAFPSMTIPIGYAVI